LEIFLKDKNALIPFNKLYQLYSTDIYRYSLSILKDEDDAKDALQETFIRYSDHEKDFRGEASQKTWLLITARNYCYSILRRAENRNTRIEEGSDNYVHNPDYDTELTLNDAIDRLAVEENELFFLKVHSNYSYAEIAELTNQTVENVAVKLHRIRNFLKKIVKDYQ